MSHYAVAGDANLLAAAHFSLFFHQRNSALDNRLHIRFQELFRRCFDGLLQGVGLVHLVRSGWCLCFDGVILSISSKRVKSILLYFIESAEYYWRIQKGDIVKQQKSTMLDAVIINLNASRGDWETICHKTAIKYSWLSKVAEGRINEPGVRKIQRLHDYFGERK